MQIFRRLHKIIHIAAHHMNRKSILDHMVCLAVLLLGLGGVGFSDLYVLGGQLSRRVLGKSGFSFWAGTLFYVGILSAP